MDDRSLADIERQNHQRFMTVIEYAEGAVRKRFQDKWKSENSGVDWNDDQASRTLLLKRLDRVNAMNKDHVKAINNKPLKEWDLSLLLLISQELKCIGKKFFPIFRDGRNAVAHAAGGKLPTDVFEKHFDSYCSALVQEFNCDRNEILKLKTIPLESDTTIGMKDENEAIDAAKKCKEEGNRFFVKGDLENAEKEYSKGIMMRGFIKTNKRLMAELYLNRSQTRAKLNKLREAINDATDASRMDDSWYKPFFRLGEMHKKCDQHGEAIHSFETALNLVPERDDELKSSINLMLSECRHHDSIRLRNENFNLQYNPTAATFGGLGEAIRASQGLGANQVPINISKLIDGLPNDVFPPVLKCYVDAKDYSSKGNFDMALKKYVEGATIYKDPDAMYNLAIMYSKGMGCTPDLKKSHFWFMKTIECPEPNKTNVIEYTLWKAGVSHAYNALGISYKLGIHVEKSMEKSIEYFNKGADLGCASAQTNLASHYLNDVDFNLPLAKDYLRLAVENEMPANEAMLEMSKLYMRIPNIDAAIRWTQTAISYGLTTAEEYLDGLKSMKSKVPDGSIDELPIEMKRPIETLFNLAQKKSTPNIKARSIQLSDLLGIPKPSPFISHLIEAKKKLDEITSIMYDGEELEPLRKAVFQCVTIYRDYPDTVLVANFEARRLLEIYKNMEKSIGNVDDEYKKNLELLEVILGGDVNKCTKILQKLSSTNPNDAYIAELYGSILMFERASVNRELAIAKLNEALALYGKTLNDSSPQIMSILYSIGAAYAISDADSSTSSEFALGEGLFTKSGDESLHRKRARVFLERYLKVAVPFGHRKLPEAYFTLAFYPPKGNGDLGIMKDLFRKGLIEKYKIPEIARDPHESPREIFLSSLFSDIVDQIKTSPKLESQLFGGQGLGSRAYKLLICNKPHYLHVKRKQRAEAIESFDQPNFFSRTSTLNLHPDIGKLEKRKLGSDSEIFVEEMISYRKDQAFAGRVIKCVIVTPNFKTVANNIIVEDEMRDSINVAIYNASDSFLKKLVVGRVITIKDPHLRISNSYLFQIRVENPNERIAFTDQMIPLCWGCLKITPDLSNCSRCKQAKYCSKECQNEDWYEYGHKHQCKSLKQ